MIQTLFFKNNLAKISKCVLNRMGAIVELSVLYVDFNNHDFVFAKWFLCFTVRPCAFSSSENVGKLPSLSVGKGVDLGLNSAHKLLQNFSVRNII